MKPKTNLELLDFIFEQMEKLDKDEITIEQAKAQSNLAKQANNILRYELDRANMEMKVRTFNLENGSNVEIRNIESKKFDDTVK
jgi:hypothetical protein